MVLADKLHDSGVDVVDAAAAVYGGEAEVCLAVEVFPVGCSVPLLS